MVHSQSSIHRAHEDNQDVYIIKDEHTLREWTVNVNKLRPYFGRMFLSEAADEAAPGPTGTSDELPLSFSSKRRPERRLQQDSRNRSRHHTGRLKKNWDELSNELTSSTNCQVSKNLKLTRSSDISAEEGNTSIGLNGNIPISSLTKMRLILLRRKSFTNIGMIRIFRKPSNQLNIV